MSTDEQIQAVDNQSWLLQKDLSVISVKLRV